MTSDKIQDLSFCGLRYARYLGDDIDETALERAEADYSYIETYSYRKLNVPGFVLARVQETPIIDLAQREEEIQGKFHALTRRGIRKSRTVPDLTFAVPDRDATGSYAFYRRTKAGDGVVPDLKREFMGCVFFNAYYRSVLIASLSFYGNGVIFRCKHIVSARKEMNADRKIAAYAARRLVWEICRYAKERGYAKLDLGGINFTDPAKRGVVQFKSSFGGRIAQVYVYHRETGMFKFVRKALSLFGRNIH